MKRGEIRWYTFRPPDKRRPILVLARDAVVDSVNEVVVLKSPSPLDGTHEQRHDV